MPHTGQLMVIAEEAGVQAVVAAPQAAGPTRYLQLTNLKEMEPHPEGWAYGATVQVLGAM